MLPLYAKLLAHIGCIYVQAHSVPELQCQRIYSKLQKEFHFLSAQEVLQSDVSFREGCVINASYGKRQNQSALFAILKEKKDFILSLQG